LDSIGLFDESLLYAEDYDLWLRIGRSHSIGYINKPLVRYRRDHTSTLIDTVSQQHFERLALQKVDALEAWRAFTRLHPTPEQCYEAWIWFLLRSGHPGFAEEASMAIAWHPQSDSLRFALGIYQYDSGDYEQAQATFEAMSASDAACLNNAGVLAALSGDFESAVPRFRAALRMCPGYRDAQANLTAPIDGQDFRLTRRPFRPSLIPFP
jgi:tetratricopeptide (TPR) repeat protein